LFDIRVDLAVELRGRSGRIGSGTSSIRVSDGGLPDSYKIRVFPFFPEIVTGVVLTISSAEDD
jgi:hypothetical protein